MVNNASHPLGLEVSQETSQEKKKGTVLERFWNKVSKDSSTGCWNWIGLANRKGYGRMRLKGRRVFVHRLSLAIHGRPLLDGECALHTCDNPRCVNPDHLKAGNRSDNRADCMARKRQAIGERIGPAKLTEAAVKDIRANYRYRKTPLRIFAKRHGVGTSAVHRIVKNMLWNHV